MHYAGPACWLAVQFPLMPRRLALKGPPPALDTQAPHALHHQAHCLATGQAMRAAFHGSRHAAPAAPSLLSRPCVPRPPPPPSPSELVTACAHQNCTTACAVAAIAALAGLDASKYCNQCSQNDVKGEKVDCKAHHKGPTGQLPYSFVPVFPKDNP